MSADDFTTRLCVIRPALVRFAFRFGGGRAAAEDLAQDAIVKALKNRHQFDGRNMTAWLQRIICNEHHTQYRQVRYDRQFRTLYVMPSSGHCGGAALSDMHTVAAKIGELNSPYRECLHALARNEGNYLDIGAELGVPPGTVKSRVSRARDALAAKLVAA